jgi:dTDP-4-dehydrorhamnose reductase
VYPTSLEFDLSRTDRLSESLQDLAPTGIINCAGYTSVDQAEQEEGRATVVNGAAVGVMAGYASAEGIPFVTFSSDYVFDGALDRPYVESDSPAPINAYGRSKVVGEQAALTLHCGALVIRTSWLISGTHPNFVARVLVAAREREEIPVAADRTGCPTVVGDLAAATLSGPGGWCHRRTASRQRRPHHLVRTGPQCGRVRRRRPREGEAGGNGGRARRSASADELRAGQRASQRTGNIDAALARVTACGRR